MTTVLVTAGNGLLGSSVVRDLADAGLSVVSGDLALPATPTPGAVHVHLDVTDRCSVDRALTDPALGPVDVVVHLASILTPAQDSSRERQYVVDVTGSRHVLDACLAHGVRRVVVASSAAAYGYHADNPVPLTEDDPIRGNEAFACSHHTRLVEEMLAELRTTHPGLEQVVLRIGAILGEGVDPQITGLFDRARLLRIRGAVSPFVFVWDTDVVAIITRAVTSEATGVFNVAGDGTLTVEAIAAALGKSTLTLPEPALRVALRAGRRLGLTAYGPEQTVLLRHRPVLANDRLKSVFGYTPTKTSAEAFEAWLTRSPG